MRSGARLLAGVAVAALTVAGAVVPWPGTLPAHADAYRNLTAGDFYGYQRDASWFVTNGQDAVVTGAQYTRAIIIHNCGYHANGVAFNTRRFPGYKGISFTVGISDRSDIDVRTDFTVTADGRSVYKESLQQGQVPRRVTLMFSRAEVLGMSAVTRTQYKCADVVLGNPIAVHSQPVAGSEPPATKPRPLRAPDFYGYQRDMSSFATNNGAAVIAGDHYGRAVIIHNCGYNANGVSLNAVRLRGYRAVRFDVGIEDGNDVDMQADFTVLADGKRVYSTALRQGQLAAHITVPFNGAEVLSFAALTQTHYQCSDVLIANPVALP